MGRVNLGARGQHGKRLVYAFLIPPLIPAILLIISMWVLPRYDVIYVPVLNDIFFGVVGYVFSFIFNAIIILPICTLFSSRISRNLLAGFGLSVMMAFAGMVIALANNKSDGGSFFLFLAILLTTWSSFYYVLKARHNS